ncbi:MAG: hypothetical protein RIB67_11560 [Miltoncostaeaceae bacterium]
MPRRPTTLLPALAIALLAMIAAACGPEGPTEAGGEPADAVALLTILPSPGALRGAPAAPVDEAGLIEALTGSPDPELTTTLEDRRMQSAAVRRWSGPGDQELVAAVSVWESHLVATGIGGQAAELLQDDGASAWTPSGLNGSRGARLEDQDRTERRLAFAVGPNSLYVRSVGDVDEETLTRAMTRLIRSSGVESG